MSRPLAGDLCNSKMFCLSEGSCYKSNLLVIVTLQGLVDSYIRLCSLSTYILRLTVVIYASHIKVVLDLCFLILST